VRMLGVVVNASESTSEHTSEPTHAAPGPAPSAQAPVPPPADQPQLPYDDTAAPGDWPWPSTLEQPVPTYTPTHRRTRGRRAEQG
jgi:hypothetical protein